LKYDGRKMTKHGDGDEKEREKMPQPRNEELPFNRDNEKAY